MALLFSPSVAGLLVNNGIKNGFDATAASVCISLHAGTKPTAAQVISNWTSYNAAATDTLWVGSGFVFSTTGNTMYASTIGTGVTPLRDGTATWGIIWLSVAGNTLAPFNASTIASAYQRFIVGDVTDVAGTGLIRLPSTTITVAGGALQVTDAGLTVTTS